LFGKKHHDFPEAAGRDLPSDKTHFFIFPHRRQVQPHTGEKEIARTMESRHLDGNLDW